LPLLTPNSVSNVAVKVVVVSNFDTRLRKLLKDLNVIEL
jgi:putative cell wall-binding protein